MTSSSSGAPAWRKYQTSVADLFRALDFVVHEEVEIVGARGTHVVDVLVAIKTAGLEQQWIIECKHWKNPVPKERILTFLGVVADVGADRGLMFCERGFQAGAIRSALNTNVTLASLADFGESLEPEIRTIRSTSLETRTDSLNQELLSAWFEDNLLERERIRSRYCGPVDIAGRSGPSTVMARLSQMRESLVEARHGRWPTAYYELDADLPIFVYDWDGLFFLVENTITTCERIYNQMVGTGVPVTDWHNLQPDVLSEMLASLRENSGKSTHGDEVL